MSRRTIGIVDYGVGNHASVWRALHALDYRCRISRDPAVLSATDLLLLPGVGAFPPAMRALHQHGLVGYLQEQARTGRPFVGICLGMQLMADASSEFGVTAGLGLIPGQVNALPQATWHIGWNSIETVGDDTLLRGADGCAVYFNHSFTFDAAAEYRIGLARLAEAFTVAVRRENMVGLQFHPEKSQATGRAVLRNVIEGLCRA
ncbi:MAG: imidazole glycerol phosphate synthase subunit HisH [Proteobacteria bacterium]|jgi:imidazole glycerol-phosphate synthase subunit HisH|nr:imidazole glycerol phosphate synthase subunit HisH [Pseudomonadota bacterium]